MSPKLVRCAILPAVVMWMNTVSAAGAQESAVDLEERLPVDPHLTVGTLENGLRYYIRANQRPEDRAELRVVLNAGSVLEDEDQLGLAHFVEHMAFNGTEHFPKLDLIHYLEAIGMRFGPDVNAYTSFDETVFELTVPTDSVEVLEQAFQILEDWAHGVTFDPEQIELERGVVIEEWRLGRGAAARMRDKQFPVLFRDSRYADRLPIGKPEILEGFDHESLTRYYRDWYRPDLMAVIAVGDFDIARIETLIREHFAELPSATDPRERAVFDVPDHEEPLVAIATDEEATQSSVSVYYKQPVRDVRTVRQYRQTIVEGLYNGMLNGRFFELTQTPDAPFLVGSSGQGRLVRSGEVYVLSALAREGEIARALETLLTEAERVARHGFTATEFERQKSELLSVMEAGYAEREKTRSARYVSEYVLSFLEDEPAPGIQYEFELYQRLAPGLRLQEVNRLAREWLTDRNRVVLVSAPEKEDVELPTESELLALFDAVKAKDIEPYEDAVANLPLVASVPKPGEVVSEETIAEIGVTVWELANGATVILKPTDFQDDQIVFAGMSPGGTSLAPDEGYIPAATAARLILEGGVGEFTLVNLDKVLAGKNANVQPFIQELHEGVSGRASPKDVETLFQLAYLYFTEPRLDSTAYLAYKSWMDAFLRNQSADPQAVFRDTVRVTMTQQHIRARPFTAELLEEMDLEESLAFYRDRFADASDFTFVLVGNFDVDSLKPLVQAYLGGLPSTGRVESWRDVGMDPPAGVLEKVVRKGLEPKSQTEIIFTGPIADDRAARHALRSMGDVLQVRLRETLREALGGTYSVSVGASAAREPDSEYSVRVAFGAAPDRVDDLVAVVFAHIDSLRASGATESELARVKETQRRARETSLKNNGYWLSLLLSAARYGTDFREILAYEELIDGLSAEAIQQAARQYLRPGNYVRLTLFPENWN